MELLCVAGAGIAVSLVMAWAWHHLLMPRHMQLGRTGRVLVRGPWASSTASWRHGSAAADVWEERRVTEAHGSMAVVVVILNRDDARLTW